jgi:hypothetical protein
MTNVLCVVVGWRSVSGRRWNDSRWDLVDGAHDLLVRHPVELSIATLHLVSMSFANVSHGCTDYMTSRCAKLSNEEYG